MLTLFQMNIDEQQRGQQQQEEARRPVPRLAFFVEPALQEMARGSSRPTTRLAYAARRVMAPARKVSLSGERRNITFSHLNR